jgi:hypothetical protein
MNSNGGKMLGRVMQREGCGFGRTCTCNARFLGKAPRRTAKRRERRQWKKEI